MWLSRLLVVLIVFGLFTPADAQQPKKIPRIGYLATRSGPSRSEEAFLQGLRSLGYIERQTILIEWRFARENFDRLSELANELVHLKVDVIVSGNLATIRAAKEATKTIPIVMVVAVDPVATGLVDSLAHPGGNITGLTRLTRELNGKRLELLKELIPRITRIGVLWNADNSSATIAFKEYEATAPALKMQLQSLEVRGSNPDLEGAFQAAVKERASALVIVRDTVLNRYRKRIADLAIKHRLPSMYEGSDYVDAGGLVSYSANEADLYRRAATYVDKILKGAKPADLPVEQPTKFEFVINLKAAKEIGLTIPPNVLARADKVIK
jgi:putative tryptophan/tyrosine transport system substrate-binding protein